MPTIAIRFDAPPGLSPPPMCGFIRGDGKVFDFGADAFVPDSAAPSAKGSPAAEMTTFGGVYLFAFDTTAHLDQFTDGDLMFVLMLADGTVFDLVESAISAGSNAAATTIPAAGGVVTACTPGAGGTITLLGSLPGPSGSYVGRKLYFTDGALATVETAACTAHVNNGGGSATFTFATAPAVATDGTASAIVMGSP